VKILQLCLRVPYPPRDGGSIAMNNFSDALVASNFSVKIVAFNTKKHFVDTDQLPSDYLLNFGLETVYLDASLNIFDALVNLFTMRSYNIARFNVPEMHKLLKEVLKKEKFDVVIIESLFMASYISTIRDYSSARIIYRSHNIEHLIWERLSFEEKNPFKKLYIKYLAETLKEFEVKCMDKFDHIIAMTDLDRDWYINHTTSSKISVVPISVKLKEMPVPSEKSFKSIFHLGSMDWMPNIEGID